MLTTVSPAPNPSRFSGVLEGLEKSALHPHSAHSHKFKVSGDRLPLSRFKLGARGLLIWHFWQADIELAQQHNNLLSLSIVLGIR
jgi:hypothetical protein